MSANPIPTTVLLAVLSGLSGGCVLPSVRLERAVCTPVVREGVLDSLRFTADFTARGLAGEQLIYEVVLVNGRLEPIPSRDHRYRNKAGHIAAGKTLLVGGEPWEFKDVTVSLPATQLELRRSDLPVLAEFSLYRTDGTCLARQLADVRITARPRPSPQPAARQSAGAALPPPTATALVNEMARDVAQASAIDTSQPAARDAARAASLWDWALSLKRYAPPSAQGTPAPTRAAGQARPAAPSSGYGSERQRVQNATEALSSQAVDSPPRPVQSAPATREYIVEDGDTLSGIAARELGDARRWVEIYELNRDRLAHPDVIRPGLRLRLPRPESRSAAGVP